MIILLLLVFFQCAGFGSLLDNFEGAGHYDYAWESLSQDIIDAFGNSLNQDESNSMMEFANSDTRPPDHSPPNEHPPPGPNEHLADMSRFYFIAPLVYPCDGRSYKGFGIFHKAIASSSFQYSYGPFAKRADSTLHQFFTNPSANVVERLDRLEGFLYSLSLRNLTFLHFVHKEVLVDHHDALIQNEMKNTLDWLDNVLHNGLKPKYKDNLAAIVNEHMKQEPQFKKTAFINCPSKTNPKRYISTFEAEQVKVALMVLENYYKEKNKYKWGLLFQEDESFYKFYVKLKATEVAHNRSKYINNHLKYFDKTDFLPWDSREKEEKRHQYQLTKGLALPIDLKSTLKSTLFGHSNLSIQEQLDGKLFWVETSEGTGSGR